MTNPVSRSGEVSMMLGAVAAGLAVLGDHEVGDHQQCPHPKADLGRVEQYLRAALEVASPWAPDRDADVVGAVRAACEHLRAGELPDAYLALHAARRTLTR